MNNLIQSEFCLAVHYYNLHQYDDAKQHIKVALSVTEGNPLKDHERSLLHTMLGEIYCLAQKIKRAFQHVDKAIQLNPLNYLAYAWKGRIHFIAYQFDEAKSAAKKAIEIEPMSCTAHSVLATVYDALNDIVDALSHYSIVIQRDPQNEPVKERIAILKQSQESFRQAREMTLKCQLPWDVHQWVLLGQLYDLEGNRVKAKEAFENALKLDPTHYIANNYF
ncbi:MAG TPA: tetratricopeptide repeat protein [Chlamydiales bacterium]|nr:tetratricopeptide repeat protein [Chlamydiales bacterium]